MNAIASSFATVLPPMLMVTPEATCAAGAAGAGAAGEGALEGGTAAVPAVPIAVGGATATGGAAAAPADATPAPATGAAMGAILVPVVGAGDVTLGPKSLLESASAWL